VRLLWHYLAIFIFGAFTVLIALPLKPVLMTRFNTGQDLAGNVMVSILATAIGAAFACFGALVCFLAVWMIPNLPKFFRGEKRP